MTIQTVATSTENYLSIPSNASALYASYQTVANLSATEFKTGVVSMPNVYLYKDFEEAGANSSLAEVQNETSAILLTLNIYDTDGELLSLEQDKSAGSAPKILRLACCAFLHASFTNN